VAEDGKLLVESWAILGHVNLQFSIDYLLLGIKVREILPL
jgi:hypothetical protein